MRVSTETKKNKTLLLVNKNKKLNSNIYISLNGRKVTIR
jgi:hypothetical protein